MRKCARKPPSWLVNLNLRRCSRMRYLLPALLLLCGTMSFAAQPAFDALFLEHLPAQRAQALRKAEATGTVSTADINTKSEAYYSTLKQMVRDIRSRCYFHSEFPADLCTALEKHAVVLAGIEYPLSGATGASGYAALVTDTRIRLAEEMICRMSRAIHEEAYWDQKTNKASKKSVELYCMCLDRWNAKRSA